MINKVLKYASGLGIALSIIGIILKLVDVLEGFDILFDKIYHITIVLSVLFVLTVNNFVSENFNLILKTLGIVALLLLCLNLLKELGYFEIEFINKIPLFLFTSLYFIYLNFFKKKEGKSKLDYLKVVFLTVLFLDRYIVIFGLYFNYLKFFIHSLFWIVIIGVLINEFYKTKRQCIKN